jgi:hypothetical protein
MTPNTPNPEIEPTGNGSGIDLRVTVRDKDGRIINEQCKEGDLYLLNWMVLMANFFKCGLDGTTTNKYYYFIQRNQTQLLHYGLFYGANNNAWANAGKVILGSSQQPPGIRDFDIAVPVKEITPSVPVISSEGNVVKVIVSGTASFTSETIVSEAGLQVAFPNTNTAVNTALITRDIFDPVTVPAGGSITLQFELWFNGMPPAV